MCPFSQCQSVCLSAKILYTKTWERIKIITSGFFLLERCIPGINSEKNFNRIARRLTKLKPNEKLNDFTGTDWLDRFGLTLFQGYQLENNTRPDWSRSHEDFRSWTRSKVLYSISWKSTLSNFEDNRKKIADVRDECNFCWSYIIRYEVILQVNIFPNWISWQIWSNLPYLWYIFKF